MGGSSPGSSSTPSTTSPSASPSTSGGRSTDLSQVKSKTDCDKAGGEWEATTSTCQKAGKERPPAALHEPLITPNAVVEREPLNNHYSVTSTIPQTKPLATFTSGTRATMGLAGR